MVDLPRHFVEIQHPLNKMHKPLVETQKPGLVEPGFSFQVGQSGQSIALKLNSPPSLIPDGQREVTVLVRV